MAISGISSYGSYNSYQYQTTLNMLRLSSNRTTAAKEYSAVQKVTGVTSDNSTYGSVQSFLKSYQSELTNLESAASKLMMSNSKNVFTDYKVASTDESVATAKETYRLKSDTNISLNVQSMAQAQESGSVAHYAQEAVEPGADMDFMLTGASGSVNISISSTNTNGTAKTYNQMYQDAAKAINEANIGVRASVTNDNGKISLKLASKKTGESNGFTVNGDTGAASGIENASIKAQDAVYTVTENGSSKTIHSESNTVSLDYGRIEAEIKGTGEAQIYTGVEEDDVVSAVKDLMESYNSVTSLLRNNSDRGTGAASHLQSFERGMADEKTLAALGITFNKDGDMVLNEKKLKEALESDLNGTMEKIGGQFGLAEKASQRADMALSDSVQRIVNNDLSTSKSTSTLNQSQSKGSLSSSFQYFSNFARSGPYNLGNYYMVGMLLNTLA